MSNNMNNFTIEEGNPLHAASSVIHNSVADDRRKISEKTKRRIKFVVTAIGIFVTYFYYGILQEKITKTEYDKEKFSCFVLLVLVQCAVYYFFAIFYSKVIMKEGEDTTKMWYYVCCALTYLLGMYSSNAALQWVNYPTQVIGKSAKPIPVMIVSVLLTHKSYSLKKYLFVLLVVVGVALFIYKDDKSGSTNFNLSWGEILILVSLLMDGLTGAIEERMRQESQTKSGHLMKNMNMWASVFLAIAGLVTGEFIKFFDFVTRHPTILWQLATISAAGAIGQTFIFIMVSDFGPLPCSIITTTRKFFTVLGSVIIFRNLMTLRQWFATVLVFTGLFLDGFFGKSRNSMESNA